MNPATEPRYTADTITDDALDDLYRQITTAEAIATSNRQHVRAIVPDLRDALTRTEAAEAALYAAELEIAQVVPHCINTDQQTGMRGALRIVTALREKARTGALERAAAEAPTD